MYNLTFKPKYNYIIFFLLAFIITCISCFYYERFKEIHLPVFDAVMNEKNQFLSFQRFKNDFSLMNRINQLIYEFQGNPLSAGFGGLIIFFAPNFFTNDLDIYLRTFFSIFIFLIVFYNYLNYYELSMIDFVLIILLIFSAQFIYDPRNGISTYIPEISAGLFLISGYISCIIFTRNKDIKWLFTGFFLMTISIIFRFNFFVYLIVFIIPFTRDIIVFFVQVSKKDKFIIFSFFLIIFLFVFLYVKQHFDFFLGYYAKPIVYQSISLIESLNFFWCFCVNNIGLYGFFAYLTCFLIFQSSVKQFKEKFEWKLLYPLLFVIIFFFIMMKATQPHIFSLILILLLISIFVNKKIIKINLKIMRYFSLLVLVSSFYSFNDLNCKILIKTRNEKNDMEVAKYLQSKIQKNKPIQFVCFHREQLEIPLQVYFFRKTKNMMEQKLKFYFHDWNFSDIDTNLSINNLTKYYSENIINTIDFVVINKNLNSDFKNFRTASLINRNINNLLQQKNKFQKIKVINKNSFNELIIFKVIRNEKR